MLKNYFENKRIVLVGPSPHLIGKNYGEFIDDFDVVIRVNELGVVSEMAKDYGSRTDIAFLALHDISESIFLKMKEEVNYKSLKLVIHPGDEYNFDPISQTGKTKNTREYFKSLDLNVNFHHIEDPPYEERCKIFGCFPSTGSVSILEILKYNFTEFYICGFSFYTTKFSYSPKGMEYMRIPKVNQHKHNIRKSGHDTRQEVKILRQILKNYKNINGDYLFRKIILSKTNLYYEIRRFIIYYLNFDNYKNIIKKVIRRLNLEK
tara:strand:+ start:2478 stop:3266 length:789 start_codon:yes stop_codon:yes gene_type:complete